MTRWDYLIVTASHPEQAEAYRGQVRARRDLGLLRRVREIMVVADLEGRRIGSGGSTLECLRLVVNRESARGATPREVLRALRILIVHAGGDSRRLPAYGPCGKIFVPVPGGGRSALPPTLFDRLAPPFLDLPAPDDGSGQCVAAAGDALLLFDPSAVRFRHGGLTMLGSPATPEEASRHGVLCAGREGAVRLYLQKPSRVEQEAGGAIDGTGRSVLDIGVTNFDAASSAALLEAFGITPDAGGQLQWSAPMRAALLERGIDLYREICCAMGEEATLAHYIRSARGAGSKWDDGGLAELFPRLNRIPFRLETLPGCRFLHFGSTRQLVASGAALVAEETGAPPAGNLLALNNSIAGEGRISGCNSWVEGCRIRAPLLLGGRNAVIGVDVDEPLELPASAALDVVPAADRWFVRCYGVDDSFKDARFLGQPIEEWLATLGARPSDIWRAGDDRTLWTARLFPAESAAPGFCRWLWMHRPETAAPECRRTWLAAPRFSSAEIALRAAPEAFHSRRRAIWGSHRIF